MPFVILGTERFALPIGESRVGGEGDDALPFPELAALSPRATLTVMPDGSATITPVGGARVLVNGAPIDAGARALAHGSRIDFDGLRMIYGEMRSNGSTVHVAGVRDEDIALLAGLVSSEGTASTGGLLTPRAGGDACAIPDEGLGIGRDPACGLVLAARDVSRHHARIAPGLLGYVLTDLSANGVLVNGHRIDGTRVLGQGDVVQIGSEEWVFTADDAPAATPIAPPAPVEPGGARATPAAAGRPLPLLATLEIINEGVLNGTRFRIERPAVHIGRGAHNDIRLRDDSVSSSHATLTRRGAEWVVCDIDSTNGTYVDGERIRGERALRGAAEVRFGGIKMVFRPIAGSGDDTMSTRVIVGG